MSDTKPLSWWKRLWKQYDDFCKEAGIDQGACRSCMPVVRFDENRQPDRAQHETEPSESEHKPS